MNDKARLANPGVVVSARGSVVDVTFDAHLSPIYCLLRAGENGQIAIVVSAQLDAHRVRGTPIRDRTEPPMKNQSSPTSQLPPWLKAAELTTERTPSNPLRPHTWSIVLAGGEGERLRVLTKRWLGKHRPKQYCAFVGNRSMLQHTLDRAVALSGMDRTLVVVARQHAPDVWDHLESIHWEQTILQPRNCGTAPGIFLPLAHIYLKDPEAIVLILPSDHFVFPEAGFLTALQGVVATAHRLPDKLVLLGAHADGPETQYGWILPGPIVDRVDGRVVRTVESFREKPNRIDAEALLAVGGLWNTMVMAARVKTLWELGRHVPAMMTAFGSLTPYLGSERESQMLDSIYERMPDVNFSSHLVEKVPGASVVVELSDVVWSDWGNEERITETLRRIGKTPLFAITSGSPDHPFPVLRKRANCNSAGTRRRAIRTTPPSRKLHL